MAIKLKRLFSDIDLRFTPHPITGDISLLFDELSIKAAVKNLILTNFYERKFHSEIGSQINSLLFEHHGLMTDVLMKTAIKETILNHEPRVDLLNVQVNSAPDNNAIYVAIEFKIKNTTKPINLNVVLERTR